MFVVTFLNVNWKEMSELLVIYFSSNEFKSFSASKYQKTILQHQTVYCFKKSGRKKKFKI